MLLPGVRGKGGWRGDRRVTLGADKNYDTREFVKMCRDLNVVPHVTQNVTNRRSAIDRRTTRHAGCEVSQRQRRRVEQVFGWLKSLQHSSTRTRAAPPRSVST